MVLANIVDKSILSMVRSFQAKEKGEAIMERETLRELFLSKIEKTGDGCWIWIGPKTTAGGYLTLKDGDKLAHRISYELFNKDLIKQSPVHRTCKNAMCVNPAHLYQRIPTTKSRKVIQ
jgi:hypothetical protein